MNRALPGPLELDEDTETGDAEAIAVELFDEDANDVDDAAGGQP
jgi:hypothetical protein